MKGDVHRAGEEYKSGLYANHMQTQDHRCACITFAPSSRLCYTLRHLVKEGQPLEKRLARSYQIQPQTPIKKPASNQLPHDLVLALMVQGYPLEELLEFFPMFTLDQLMLLLDEDVIH